MAEIHAFSAVRENFKLLKFGLEIHKAPNMEISNILFVASKYLTLFRLGGTITGFSMAVLKRFAVG